MNPLYDYEFSQAHYEFLESFNKSSSQDEQITAFKEIIKHYHKHKRRPFAWRDTISPYNVVVSEIMLQQTQTDRVIQKFNDFINTFSTFEKLAAADFSEVLRLWKGLGYNRRAQALQKIAHIVITEYNGQLPKNPDELEKFPGIGYATARSIAAFAYNIPTVFIETNIRTVFIYFFFRNSSNVHDKELIPFIEKTIDHLNPREWYYALMDYGVLLKKTVGNVSKNSAHYTKQSPFHGSDRQIRGLILEALLNQKTVDLQSLFKIINKDQSRVERILEILSKEQFITIENNYVQIATDALKSQKEQ